MQIPILLSMSLCGHNNTGCDIGGFFGDPSSELLVRWLILLLILIII